MMDSTFVKEIERISTEAAASRIDVEGEVFTPLQMHRLPKPEEPAALTLHTLQGLVDYVTANRDELKAGECMIVVDGPTEVRVVSRLWARNQRFIYVKAVAEDLSRGFSGTPHPMEDAIVTLQSRFTDAGDRDRVLKLLGNVTENAELLVQDDGVTQRVTTRAGAVLKNDDQAPVPNPVELAPFRTFREVDQPSSPFVMRLRKGGPTVAFHEADGGAWKLEAVEAIAEWLDGQVGEFQVIR